MRRTAPRVLPDQTPQAAAGASREPLALVELRESRTDAPDSANSFLLRVPQAVRTHEWSRLAGFGESATPRGCVCATPSPCVRACRLRRERSPVLACALLFHRQFPDRTHWRRHGHVTHGIPRTGNPYLPLVRDRRAPHAR